MRNIVSVVAVIMLAACHTVKYADVPVEVRSVVHDTVVRSKMSVVVDTVMFRDSVVVAGDTVVYHYQGREVTRWRIRVDTLMEARTDTVRVPVYISRTSSQDSSVTTKGLLWWLVLAAVLAAVFVMRKK